jgi:hypothetical protein
MALTRRSLRSGDLRRGLPSRVLTHQQGVNPREIAVDGIVYLVGLVVIVMFILSFLGLR